MSRQPRPRFENVIYPFATGVLVRHFMQGYDGDPGFPASGLVVDKQLKSNNAWWYLVLWSDGEIHWHDCAELVLLNEPRFDSWEESMLADLQYWGGDC